MSGGAALERLRAATRPLHARAEAAVGLDPATMGPPAYRAFLARWWGILTPLEPVCGLEPPRAPLLRADLAALGLPDDAVAALPLCRALPALPTPSHALGCRYVLEGSALGGQVILRALEGRHPELLTATRFLRGPGPLGPRWRAFLTGLEAHLAGGEAAEGAVIEGAQATFAAFEGWWRGGEGEGGT